MIGSYIIRNVDKKVYKVIDKVRLSSTTDHGASDRFVCVNPKSNKVSVIHPMDIAYIYTDKEEKLANEKAAEL